MNKMKKIIIEEAAKVLREMKSKQGINKTKSDLYEAVRTAGMVKNNPKKYSIAKKLIAISEARFIKERQHMKETHGHEDESEMAKAQLAAIMEKSNELYRMLDGVSQLEDWLQYKLSIAENYIDAVHGYIKYFNGGEEMDTDEIDDNDQWDDVEEEDIEDEDDSYYDDGFDDFDDFDEDEEFEDEEFEDEDEDGDMGYYFSAER